MAEEWRWPHNPMGRQSSEALNDNFYLPPVCAWKVMARILHLIALRILHELSTLFWIYRKEEQGKYEEKELVFLFVADFKMLSLSSLKSRMQF